MSYKTLHNPTLGVCYSDSNMTFYIFDIYYLSSYFVVRILHILTFKK